MYFLFLEILDSKQILQASLLSFMLKISRKRKLYFSQNGSFESFLKKDFTSLFILFYVKDFKEKEGILLTKLFFQKLP